MADAGGTWTSVHPLYHCATDANNASDHFVLHDVFQMLTYLMLLQKQLQHSKHNCYEVWFWRATDGSCSSHYCNLCSYKMEKDFFSAETVACQHYLHSHSVFNSYSASHGNWCTATLWNRIMTAQCEGMGEVGSARYEPALLPPCPSIRVLSYSNCQEIHSRQQTGLPV